MGSIEQHNAETITKLDEIAEQLKGITTWMRTMDETTRTLNTSASLLQLHAEDASTRLRALESSSAVTPRPPTPPGPASPSAPPHTVEVRTAQGHGVHPTPRGPVFGDPPFPQLPPAHDFTGRLSASSHPMHHAVSRSTS
nr:uncharacterized protein LOC109748578 [Aegilops tauschii subsp. strangulata]